MIMYVKLGWLLAAIHLFATTNADELLGCGGFLKSHVQIDFSKVLIKLVTKQGVVKDQTNCAPKTGYYFIPLYDRGDYILQLEPPPGWSFTPNKIDISVDGKTDLCSLGKDINFVFKGFGIAGKVLSHGSTQGPAGIKVKLISENEVRDTTTDSRGEFVFTPVYPGEHTIVASHDKWKFIYDKVSITVKEGNTNLKDGLLSIAGYDVKGYVKIDGAAVSGAKVLIFSKDTNSKVEQCFTALPTSYKGPKPICHVITDTDGAFVFPTVSTGKYKLVAFMEQPVHFEPQNIEFEVALDSLQLEQEFNILGLTLTGLVTSGDIPLAGVTVIVDDKHTFITKADGSYVMTQVKPGAHTLKARSEEYEFGNVAFRVSPTSTSLPTLTPSAFKVCGAVISDKMEGHSVLMTKMGSTTHLEVQSDGETGEFCEFLSRGKYQIQVNVQDKALQFFPLVQTIEVMAPQSNIIFSQLKVTVSGAVKCINQDDCKRLKVILRPVDKADEMIANVIDGKYTVSDIRPGEYRITLSSNRLCWESIEHVAQVSNATWTAPPFINTGYAIAFISTHNSAVIYDGKKIQVTKGTTQHCVPKPGIYKFKLESCHQYESDSVDYKTSQDINEIVLTALKHRVTLDVAAKEDLGQLTIEASIDSFKNMHKLNYNSVKKVYTLELYLSPNDKVILTPQSDTVFFNPPILSINGEEDCVHLGDKFDAKKGKVFKGKVLPGLQGVQITVTGGALTLTEETDAQGNYKFPPLDDAEAYEVTATKDSYILDGPDDNGNFAAKKLAEIIVEVIDKDTNAPLQGALLSLSGAESYRSNMQTDEQGVITFSSLSPSEYFLKPMMKEYSFEPASKSINVLNGATERVILKGKRVAHSAYGQVVTLASIPEKDMVVLAAGVNNCTEYAEEATTDSFGNFRIRGLIPHCAYRITVKASLQENDVIERVLPQEIAVDVLKDLTDLRLIVFRPVANVDVYVKVYTANVEHYRSLRLKITRESPPSGLVHNIKVDNYKVAPDNNIGIMLSTPSIPLDGKVYSLQLESSISGLLGKSTVKTITADTSYKFVEVEFVAHAHVAEQQIKQVSTATLVFIFALLLAAYNVDKIVEFAKANFNLQSSMATLSSKAKTATPEHHLADAEIEKIVENINAPKKRVKSKRV